MFKKISLVALVVFFLLIGAVSASDDMNATDLELTDNSLDDDLAVGTISSDEGVLKSNSHTIDSSNYAHYFNQNSELIESKVESGDIIYLNGTLSDYKFIFNKKVNIVGTDSNNMKNSEITLLNGASGSSISKLNIRNTNDYAIGIFLDNANNCSVDNCFINNTGQASYCICVANDANYNHITNNQVSCYGVTYGHGGTRSTSPLVVSGSHHNYIFNNNVEADDANGIYLTSYNHNPVKGGVSDFNIILNNTVHYNVLPTSWSYGIQVMGGNNIVKFNKVIGGYRGISSSSGENNTIINNYIINLTGADYNNLGVEVGGEYGIVSTPNSIIANNSIINAKIIGSGAGISVIDNSIAENNFINVTGNGKGIEAGGSNVIIRNNIIFTEFGSGIHEKDEGSGLIVENNTITSVSGVGILIEQLNLKRMPSNVTVIKNTISTNNKNAIEASGVQANSSNIDLFSNKIIGPGNIVSPAGIFDASKPIYIYNGQTHYITPYNIRDYINVNGGLGPEIKEGDILNFDGNFTNEIIFITKGVKITGNNPIFYNSSFKITSTNVLIENITIINKMANRVNAWGIFVNKAEGVKIVNNNINVNDPKASYAIYVLESSDVDIIGNNLTSEGTYLTFTLLSYASENCVFSNNTICTVGTDEIHAFEAKKCLDGEEACLDGNEFCLDGGHIVPEIYRTYGILLLYSSNNIVSGNDVNVTSRIKEQYPTTGANSSTNSLVGIDLYYNSHNNTFSNNNVFVKGKDNYIYGMGVLGYMTSHPAPEGQGASNNKYIKNNISLDGSYFATGIIVGWESKDTLLQGNILNVKSEGVVYGITLEMSQKSVIEDNDLNLNSQIIYGIDLISSSENNIVGNNLNANSKLGCGVLFSDAKNNHVSENLIAVNSSGENLTVMSLDFIPAKDSGIYFTSFSTKNIIINNVVYSSLNYAIVIDEEATDNLISDNSLDSKNGIGNNAIYNIKGNNISNNYKFIANATFNKFNVEYLGTGEFIINFNGDVDGAIVKFYDMNDEYLGESTVKNRSAQFKYKFDESFTPSTYIFKARFFKENYKLSIHDLLFGITKANLSISLNNISIIQGASDTITAKVSNQLGNPLVNVSVEFSRINSVGKIVSIGSATTDKSGLSKLNYSVSPSLNAGLHNILVEISGLSYYNDGKALGNLTVLPRLSTIITINKKIYVGGVFATLKDSNGDLIANKKVSLKVGSAYYTISSNAKGELILPTKINKGSYKIVVTSAAKDKYEEATKSCQIKVLPTITGNKDYSVYYGNTVKYKVRILNTNGKPVSTGKTVVFTIDGKNKNVKIDKKGYATYSIKLKVGKHTVVVKNGGCKVSNKITFKKTISTKNISKKKSKIIKFSAKLVNKKGKILKNKKITFKIKGKKYTAKTNKKGIATVSIKKLKVGKYTITSSYGGCTVKNIIRIKK